ncbi:MAG TPA: hypothetical protein VF868_10750 [Bacteroidia bacterium]|jgi:hypothetical protein
MVMELKRKDARIEVPAHQEEVLISYGGLYYIGRYNNEAKGFNTREGNFFVVHEKGLAVYWSELPKS